MTDNFVYMPAKDPQEVRWYFFVFCDLKTGLNDGSANDKGDLQGATIATKTVTPASGITVATESLAAVTIGGVSYGINTVVAVRLSGGTDGTDYPIECLVTTNESPAQTFVKTMVVPVRQK